MLLIANGAYKSGSTWLYNILQQLTEFAAPPPEFNRNGWVEPSIHPDRLQEFLDNYNSEESDYLIKAHYGSPEIVKIIESYKSIKVCNIHRNLRDVVVSAYHYESNKGMYNLPFNLYYWKKGRYTANTIHRYHYRWNESKASIYTISFEGLKNDFALEIMKISDFLGIHTDKTQIQNIKNVTSINSLKKKYAALDNTYTEIQFFRKGRTGDWKNHFDLLSLADMKRLEKKHLYEFTRFQKMLAMFSKFLYLNILTRVRIYKKTSI